MVAYEVFRSLGINIMIRPIAQHIRQYEGYIDLSNKVLRRDIVGDAITECIDTGASWGEDGTVQDVYEAYPSTLQKIKWINSPTQGTEEMQFSYARVS
jgi:hypothetical protein